eukprot:11183501-Lingulodinium_polyedra.AAC.1
MPVPCQRRASATPVSSPCACQRHASAMTAPSLPSSASWSSARIITVIIVFALTANAVIFVI